MGRSFYQRVKDILPGPLRKLLGALNQAVFARWTLRRKYGDWFDVDWRKKFRTLSDDEWKEAYDRAWRQRRNDCVGDSEAALFLEALPGRGTVLEVGCGMGSLAIRLAQAGHTVTGLDVSREALVLAGRQAKEVGVSVEWVEGFAERLPFEEKSFDYIVCAHTLEHVRDLQQTVGEFKRVAKRRIVILTPRQQFKLYMDNYHTQFFETKDDLVSAFGLPGSDCREIDTADEANHFQGKAWFYVGRLPEEQSGTNRL